MMANSLSRLRNLSGWLALCTSTTLLGFPPQQIAVLNLSPDDPDITQAATARVKRLQSCGFTVRDYSAKDDRTLRQSLSSGDSSLDYFFIESHGGWEDNEYKANPFEPNQRPYFFSNKKNESEKGTPVIDSDSLVNLLESRFPKAQLWVDACYGGACKTSKCHPGMGSACSEREKSWNHSGISDGLVDLLCSSRGDCQLFNSADKNSNGRLDAKEISGALAGPNSKSSPTSESLTLKRGSTEDRAFRAECTRREGKLTQVRALYEHTVHADKLSTGDPLEKILRQTEMALTDRYQGTRENLAIQKNMDDLNEKLVSQVSRLNKIIDLFSSPPTPIDDETKKNLREEFASLEKKIAELNQAITELKKSKPTPPAVIQVRRMTPPSLLGSASGSELTAFFAELNPLRKELGLSQLTLAGNPTKLVEVRCDFTTTQTLVDKKGYGRPITVSPLIPSFSISAPWCQTRNSPGPGHSGAH